MKKGAIGLTVSRGCGLASYSSKMGRGEKFAPVVADVIDIPIGVENFLMGLAPNQNILTVLFGGVSD